MRQAKRRKYHYIYRTTCKVTGKYYIGMHSTDDLNDGYVGSGKRLRYSIGKHGIENHVFEIIEHYFTREWLREREAELVCAETLTDPMCMNLKLGGDGGWEHIHKVRSKDEYARICQIAGRASADYFRSNPERHKIRQAKSAASQKGRPGIKSFAGKNHTQATKDKMSFSHAANGKSIGEGNSQYGTCWIHNVEIKSSKKIRKDELSAYLQNGWAAGRKMKF